LTQAAEAMAISAGPGAEATPQAVNDDRLARPREPMTEPPRREIPSIRREQPAAAASGGQLGSTLRAMRERLPQR
jgi:hypothetical protein